MGQLNATSADAAPTYHWNDVLARIGEPTKDERALYALATPRSELVSLGNRISTQKVLTDFVRWLGTAFDHLARTPDAVAVLGLSPALLRVMAAEGGTLRGYLEQRAAERTTQATDQGTRLEMAAQEFDLGSKRREQLRAALATATQDTPTHRLALENAYGTERDHHALSSALRSLAALARKILASAQDATAKRLLEGGVTPGFLNAVEDLAGRVAETGDRASGARSHTGISQTDLDAQDGICLTYMRHLRDMFEAAHDLDPTVPRLVPIATRSVFQHPKRPTAPQSSSIPAPPNGPGPQANA